MKLINYISILLVFALTLSCVRSHNSRSVSVDERFKNIKEDSLVYITGKLDSATSDVINIEVPQFDYKSKVLGVIDDIFDTLKVVYLETAENCIIGNITQMEILRDTIYIRDQYMAKGVFAFDMQGKFLNRIGAIGQGPYEFVEPTDMHVTDDAVIVFDQWQNKIIKYRHSGERISERRIPFLCFMMMELSENSYLYRGINSCNKHMPSILNYQFWHGDSTNNIDKVGLYREYEKYGTYLSWQHLVRSVKSNESYFYSDINDTIYQINTDGGFIPKYKFDFKSNHNLEHRLFDNPHAKKASNQGEYISLTSFQFFDNYVLYSLLTAGRSTMVLQNLITKEARYYNSSYTYKSNLSRLLYLTDPIARSDDWFVFNVRASKIKNMYEQVKTESKWWEDAPLSIIEFDKKLGEKVSEDSNDVLVFAKIKEF